MIHATPSRIAVALIMLSLRILMMLLTVAMMTLVVMVSMGLAWGCVMCPPVRILR